MPRDKSANEARHIARVVNRRAAQHDSAQNERGYRVPEDADEVEDNRALPDGDGRFNPSEYVACN